MPLPGAQLRLTKIDGHWLTASPPNTRSSPLCAGADRNTLPSRRPNTWAIRTATRGRWAPALPGGLQHRAGALGAYRQQQPTSGGARELRSSPPWAITIFRAG